MSYQVFARKYRPDTFKDVLGQDHVVQTLCNAIEQNRLAHAYLFVGPRGTGKTSTARIFAKALNCSAGPRVDFDPNEPQCLEIAEGRSMDVLEIDGASNRGIDNIRELRDNVQFKPALGQFRIIYIDEVHMLTKESFNALLKTLEEPPPHVKFIFATTEAHKILPTILSRCQRFDLRPIPVDIIAKHLIAISEAESVELSEEAAIAIARVADGGMRDALSMLDQLVSFCGTTIEENQVNEIFGVTSRDTVAEALTYILDRQLPSLLHLVDKLSESGRDMRQLLAELMASVRELLIRKVAPTTVSLSIPERWLESLGQLLERTPSDKLIRLMELLAITEERMRWSSNKRLHLEMGLIQVVHSLSEANISDVIRALQGAPLEDRPIARTVLEPLAYPQVPTETQRVNSAQVVELQNDVVEPLLDKVALQEEKVFHMEQNVIPNKSIEKEESPVTILAAAPKKSPKASAIRSQDTLEPIDDAVPQFVKQEKPKESAKTLPIKRLDAEQNMDREPSFDVESNFDREPSFDVEPSFDREPSFNVESSLDIESGMDINFEHINRPAQSIDRALWDECLAELQKRSPIKSQMIGEHIFISDDETILTLAIHPNDMFTRDALLNTEMQALLTEITQEKWNRPARFSVIIDNSVQEPEIEDLTPPALPAIEIAAPSFKKEQNKENKPQNDAQFSNKKDLSPFDKSKKQLDDEFYKDPLIELALKEFHARLIKE